MNNYAVFSVLLILLPILTSCSGKQVYIVYFGEHGGVKTHEEIEQGHHSYLFSVKESEEEAKDALVYSYKNSINGFAALLTSDEAVKLSEMEEVISVFPSREYTTHTTRSWDFVGLNKGIKVNPNATNIDGDFLLNDKFGKNVIVGMVDTGIWPESKSFRDKDMGNIPKKWRGICQNGQGFNSSHCNKKIIGARYYRKGYEQQLGPVNPSKNYVSPRDKNGHGTHTASTVAGRRVHAKALGGLAHGTASGGAPMAHLAIYKVCWNNPDGLNTSAPNSCFAEDVLAGIDAAIGDGVDVLSLSLGMFDNSYTEDAVSIGTLHALKKNIVSVCSAGNSGPKPSSLLNIAPWVITVSASSVDRAFVAPILLGNGMRIEGETLTPNKLKEKLYPLVYASEVTATGVRDGFMAGQCLNGTLSRKKAKGKIVMCSRGNGTRNEKAIEVMRVGGLGLILANTPVLGNMVESDNELIPMSAVNSDNAAKIFDYINKETNPVAYISPPETVLERKPAPYMAPFTSRGPNHITPDILKPDITAPGLHILAAWSEAASPTGYPIDKRRVKYAFSSGTSMACPHVSAAVVLLKSIHPTWSSAAVRSALITTAGQKNNVGKPITDTYGNPANSFQYGAGHFNPMKAADPGLVYDATYTDYLLFLCENKVSNFDSSFKCPKNPPKSRDLNYPSLAISNLKEAVTVRRTLTNVGGNGKKVYRASVEPPIGISVKISPSILVFNQEGEKLSFEIHVEAEIGAPEMIQDNGYTFGWFTWSDGVHDVKSPMAISLA